MLDYFTPEDNDLDDNNHQKHIRELTDKEPNTPDDGEFTSEDIGRVIEGMNNKKAPGEDGITEEIYKLTFKVFPKSITAMYNGCLKNGIFPEMEEGQNYTNHETGYTNVRGSHQISPHKPSKCGRENIGKGTVKQNKPLHVFNGVTQQEPVWIHSANEHNRRDYGFKRFCSGRI